MKRILLIIFLISNCKFLSAQSPTLVSPSDLANTTNNVTFYWTGASSASSQVLQISSDEFFTSFEINREAVSGANASGFFAGREYFWRVRAYYNSTGYSYSETRSFIVIAPPIANFTSNTINACKGDDVNFTSLTNNATGYSWDFGDGTTSTLQNPLKSYSNSGNYSVSLTVSNISGTNTITKSNFITVNGNSFTPSLTAIGNIKKCPKDTVTLVASPSGLDYSFIWASSVNTTNQFKTIQFGYQTVTITNSSGCSKSVSLNIERDTTQIAITKDKATFCLKDSVLISFQPTRVSAFTWSNGRTNTSFYVKNVGTYTLNGTDSNSCPIYGQIKIFYTFPDKKITTIGYIPSSCIKDSILLIAPNNITNYLWSNGATTPTIKVFSAGKVTLNFIDSAGCNARDSIQLSFSKAKNRQQMGFSIDGTEKCYGETFNLSDTSSITGYSRKWNYFTNSSTEKNISIGAGLVGTHTISLILSYGGLCNDTIKKEIKIYRIPQAYISIPSGLDVQCLKNNNFDFMGQQDTNSTKLIWYFGDGTTSNANKFNKSYSKIGSYTVSLVEIVGGICKDSTTKDVYVSGPEPAILYGPLVVNANEDNLFSANKFLADKITFTTSNNGKVVIPDLNNPSEVKISFNNSSSKGTITVKMENLTGLKCFSEKVFNITVKGSVGFFDNLDNQTFRVYPTVTSSLIHIVPNNLQGDLSNIEFTINDITGRKIKQLNISKLSNEYLLDVTSLLNGIYFITIKNNDVFYSSRFIKE